MYFQEFAHLGIAHVKLPCPHDRPPSAESVAKFKEILSNFVTENGDKSVTIGVHCSYGVNRASYMIARYLTECLDWSIDEAINEIELARGHTMERISLIDDLINRSKNISRKRKKLYRSTLSDIQPEHPATGKQGKCFGHHHHHHHHSHVEEMMFS